MNKIRGLFLFLATVNIKRDTTSFDDPVWVCVYDGCYLHIEHSFFKLLSSVITEFRHDKNLVGY